MIRGEGGAFSEVLNSISAYASVLDEISKFKLATQGLLGFSNSFGFPEKCMHAQHFEDALNV